MKKSLMLLSTIGATTLSFSAPAENLLGTSPTGRTTVSDPLGIPTTGRLDNLVLSPNEICVLDETGHLSFSTTSEPTSIADALAEASSPKSNQFLVFYPLHQQGVPDARRVLRNRCIVTLDDPSMADVLAEDFDLHSLTPVRDGAHVFLCEEESAGAVYSKIFSLRSDPRVVGVDPLFARKRYVKDAPDDDFYDTIDNPGVPDLPGLNYQWYLNNEGEQGGVAGIDINVGSILDLDGSEPIPGTGVTVAIIDDGLAIDHADLLQNANGPHFNVLGDNNDPTTLNTALNHGTSVASLIGASIGAFVEENSDGGPELVEIDDTGMVGVAPGATLSGIRLLGEVGDDLDESRAFSFSNDVIDIYNCSWGPSDTEVTLDGPGSLARQALRSAIENGRVEGGVARGNIFVFSAGDGGGIGDNSNYDGYANSRFTIAVGAVTDAGVRAVYSERGANLVVVAPSSGGAQGVLAAEFGTVVNANQAVVRTSEYTNEFGGTSASAALVSGVAALMLQANPELSWRDVQDIMIRTATTNDPNDVDWNFNAAGIDFNHSYGAGLIDATAAVAEAIKVRNEDGGLGPLVTQSKRVFFSADSNDPNIPSGVIPDNTGRSLIARIDMTQDDFGNPFPTLKVEHVELVTTIITDRQADLEVVLISPNGTQSILKTVDEFNEGQTIFRWPFTTVRNWGEGSTGAWILRVTDLVSGSVASLNDVALVIHGSEDADAPTSSAPVLISARSLPLFERENFEYELVTTAGATVQVGDLPAGLTYDTETRLITGQPTTPGLTDVPVILSNDAGDAREFIIRMVVQPTAAGLGEAVGLPEFRSFFGGDTFWGFELEDTDDPEGAVSPRAAISGAGLGDNETSVFGFDGLPQGVLSFSWKTSSAEGTDRLYVNRGGPVPQQWDAFISGIRQWGRVAIPLPDAANRVRFTYAKDAEGFDGLDRGFVDNAELITFEKYHEDINRAANVEGVELEFDSRTMFLPFEFPGGSPSESGPREAIRSSTIGNGQTASVAAWIEGPGTFNFRAFNFGEIDDVFEVLVDGALSATLLGSGSERGPVSNLFDSVSIPEGRHRVQLRYRKGFRGSNARVFADELIDGILLDDISFVPDSSLVNNFQSQYSDLSPSGNADGDGYTNYFEAVFGGDPYTEDVPKYLPKVVVSNSQRFVEYGVDPTRTDATYVPQQSEDLETWVPIERAVQDRTEGSFQVYRVPIEYVEGRPCLFYRVKVDPK